MTLHNTLLILLLSAWSLQLDAQSFSEALAAANNNLEAQTALGYNIEYLSYSGNTVSTSSNMRVEKLNGTTYTQLDNMESYHFGNTRVVVDHAGKSILLNKGELSQSATNGIEQQLALLQALEAQASEVRSEALEGSTRYTLSFVASEFRELVVEVNTTTGLFERLLLVPQTPIAGAMLTSDAPVTAFEVRVSTYEPELKALSKPLTEYLVKRGDQHQLQPTYSNYQYAHYYDPQ